MIFLDDTGSVDQSSRFKLAEPDVSARRSELLHDFFARAGEKESSEVRAVLFNQVPFVLSWVTSQELRDAETPHLPSEVVTIEGRQKGGRELDWRRLGGLAGETFGIRPKRISSSAPLLAATLQPNSTRAFLPVAQELRAQGVETYFLALRDDVCSQSIISAAGFQHDVVGSAVTSRAVWSIAKLMGILQVLLSDSSLRVLLQTLEVSATMMTSARLAELRRALTRQVLLAAPLVINLKEALDAHEASTILYVTHRAIFNTLLTESSRTHRRRVFFLQGVVPDLPAVGTPLDVDLAIAGSRFDLGYLDRCGIPRAHIAVTGYPEYDEFAELRREDCRLEIERAVPQARGKQLVLFTSQYRTSAFSDEARLTNVGAVLQAARLRPNSFFLLRPHPRHERLREELRDLPSNVDFCPDIPAARAITAADALITYWSTTGLEALLFGTPLVQLNATGLPDYLPLVERMGLRPCRDASDLNQHLNSLSSEAGRSDRLQLQARLVSTLGLEGAMCNAAERAAQAIGALISASDLSQRDSKVRWKSSELARRVRDDVGESFAEGFFRAG